ncbi:hypothetical protein AAFC00_001441 [Neodothiora populina]|uniref:Rad21/Rec8-like protein N-terminal domain-containing protein n=1 Tax=Neodothiora populina TaxID=2781224 RepID=A0ABR3PNW4_9PEZI
MFYSHEVLTSRQYGVATVWLVATLGAKSTSKKLNRKAILEVNVPKACETIIAPAAPMALRLQSNLLYGVVRVYSEQCGYVLVDVQNAQYNMRTLLFNASSGKLEGKHKARPDQVNLKEDALFDLSHLFDLDLDDSHDIGFTSSGASDLNSLDSSHRTGSSAPSSMHADIEPIKDIEIPPSASSSTHGLGGFSARAIGSATGSRSESSIYRREEDERMFDPGFAFDDMGNIIENIPAGSQEVVTTEDNPIMLRDPDALNRDADEDVEMDLPRKDLYRIDDDDSNFLPQDGREAYDDAEAFPTRTHQQIGVAGPSMPPSSQDDEFLEDSPEPVDDIANAPAQRVRRKKAIPLDMQQELHNSDLTEWTNNYLLHMRDASRGKVQARSTALAKRNAEYWLFDSGLGGLSDVVGREAIPQPLRMFTGRALLEAFTGMHTGDTGEKRPRNQEDEEDQAGVDVNGRRVRVRSSEGEMARANDDLIMADVGNDGGDYDYTNNGAVDEAGGETTEVGREAHTPLAEHASSLMPWNNSASLRGSSARAVGGIPFSLGGATTSSAGGGRFYGLGPPSSRANSRLVSPSPLYQHGVGGASIEPPLDFGPGLDEHMPGDELHTAGTEANVEQYEIFGPAADVPTQVANEMTWLRQTLDTESVHFLAFVQAAIVAANEGRDARNLTDVDDADDSIPFETLLPPTQNSRIVAAQGLLHVLTLATKNLLHADQDAYLGPINIHLLGRV